MVTSQGYLQVNLEPELRGFCPHELSHPHGWFPASSAVGGAHYHFRK